MCGIVAVISKLNNGFSLAETESFTQMLFANQLRGKDGTGLFYNPTKDKFTPATIKWAVPSSRFINDSGYDKTISEIYQNSKYVIGHNRAGTKGGVSNAFTHPFREDHITLIHNGTLITQKELHPTYESDSKAICYSIATKGVEETLKTINGAFALVWADTKDETINICRNDERPLYIVETFGAWFLSSELGLVKWILERNKINITSSKMVPTQTLIKFDFKDLSKYTEETVEYKEKWPIIYTPHKTQVSEWPYKDSSYSKYNSSNKNWAFGEKIRFRGVIYREMKNGGYLEGDILVDQNLSKNVDPITYDFEDEFRVRVYGKKSKLEKYIGNNRLVGKVLSSITTGGGKTIRYSVNDISVLEKTPLTVIENKKSLCGLCGNHTTLSDDNYYCDDCVNASSMYGM